MKKISDTIHSTILSLVEEGLTSRQIASRVKVSHTTVDRIQAVNSKTIQKHTGGKKAALSTMDKKHIMRMYRSGEAETAQQLGNKLREVTGKDVSHDTIARALQGAGLKGGRKQKKSLLSQRHKQQQRDLVYTYKHWSDDDWMHVIWSDEIIIECFGSHG